MQMEGMLKMKYIWIFGTIAAVYGAIAGSLIEHTPFTAVSFGLLAVVFALVAYRDMSAKN